MDLPLIVANWKMHKTAAEAESFVHALSEKLGGNKPDVVIAPAAIHLPVLAPHAQRHGFSLAAQNIHHEDEGAYTGEISAAMAAEHADYVIVGHSERRVHFGEGEDHVAKKVQAALKHDHRVLLCLHDDEDGVDHEMVLASQLEAYLIPLPATHLRRITVVLEPSWAISSFRGQKAVGEEEWVRIFELGSIVQKLLSSNFAGNVPRVIYGGSVDVDNISRLIESGLFAGGMPGRASLDVDSFAAICERALNAWDNP